MGRASKSLQRPRGKALSAALAVVCALVLTGCNDFFAAGWGSNAAGQLGTGTFEWSSVPVEVNTAGVLSDKVVIQVTADNWSSCALATDGTAYCWGLLPGGGPSQSPLPEPVAITGVLADKFVTKISAGPGGHCAVTSDGTLGCWQRTVDPVMQMAGDLAGRHVVDVEGGLAQGCALTAEGLIACWFTGPAGLIGPSLINATGVLAGKTIIDFAASCALTQDNVVACWDGDNQIPIPVEVDLSGVFGDSPTVDVTSGQHACAVNAEGAAACWGDNFFGQLGDGTTTASATPVGVLPVGALSGRKITSITAGAQHTCAKLDDESMACWGNNFFGQLGNGTQVNSLVPVAVAPLPAATGEPRPIVDVDAGQFHNMAVYQDLPESYLVPITPRRVLDTRLIGTGEPVTESVSFDLEAVVPPGATAVTFNLVATGQTASGFAALVPEATPVDAPISSAINWSGPQQTIANGHVVRLGADRRLRIDLGSSGSSHFVVDITGYFVPPGDPAGTRYAPDEQRLYDSRGGDGPLAPGESRTLNLPAVTPTSPTGATGPTSPTGATGAEPSGVQPFNGLSPTAAAVNITVTGTVGSGVVTVAGERSSATSTVNWAAGGQTIANSVVTDVSVDGSFTVTNNGQTPAEFVVDLVGQFLPASGGVGAAFFPVDPARTYDSRTSNGMLSGGQSRVVTHPVPADSVAVALNTTVTGTVGSGFLTVTPGGSGVPSTSTVNWYASPMTRANGSFVPLDRKASQAYAGGQFATHFLHDTAGFFR